jgi:ABC-type antimicrobial peptide transport system permease subunit
MSEFGIMMSLGACRKDVRRFVFLQTSISGLITLSFGLLAGSMLSILILDLVIICTGSDLDFPIDTRAAVLLAGAVLFAIVLMGIRFYRKIIRNTTAALLSENISPAIITDVLGKDKANDRY